MKPCNKAAIHLRFVLPDQSAACLHGDQMEQGEGHSSDSLQGLKLILIKYIPLQSTAAFFKTAMQNINRLATDCHSIHQWFSLRIIVGDASGMCSVHLEDNTFGGEEATPL